MTPTSPKSQQLESTPIPQQTLKRPCAFEGVGLHSGKRTWLRCEPAPANHGIVFCRGDLPGRPKIPACREAVVGTELATSLGSHQDPSVRVSTVEHLMAALFALRITNALIIVEGPEVPILDGSAKLFAESFLAAGLRQQDFTARRLRVQKSIKIFQHGAIAELLPRQRLRLTTTIDFPHPAIGLQTFAIDITPTTFLNAIAPARTFGFLKDVEALRAKRLAQGASLENVLAFSRDGVINPEGVRFVDECVRHKMLDALGDLSLFGAWIEGEMVSFRGGHHIHAALLGAVDASPDHWTMEEARPAPLSPAVVAGWSLTV
jgi:UDP-3-O-[3-hydroxymyristoyl] N-acetylglucosamine deacetylase